MSFFNELAHAIFDNWEKTELTNATLFSVLLVITLLAVYEFVVYRLVSHRAFYNKSFNISLAVLPYFIGVIVLCLQTSLVVKLGAIGVLAIIRFRTAVKDPTDMLYMLWSVFNGIMCGCRLFEAAIVTSLAVTLVMLVLEHVTLGHRPYVVVMHQNERNEQAMETFLKGATKSYRIKSRSYSGSGIDYAVEISVKDAAVFTGALQDSGLAARFSVIAYDAEDVQ